MNSMQKSVLIVEDEVLVAWDEAQAVEDAGYDVIGPAHDLSSAMNLARESNPAVAVLDINLGDVTVFPLAEYLERSGVPFAFVTADLQHPELRNRYAKFPRLTKPISEKDLIAAVNQLFGALGSEAIEKVSARR